MLAERDYLHAGEQYLHLAQLYPKKTVFYQFQAAAAYIEAGDADTAITLISATDNKSLNKTEIFQKTVLLAEIALAKNDQGRALLLLSETPPAEAPDRLLASYLRSRARAYELQNNLIDAARERIALAGYLHDPPNKQANYNHIWSDLNQISLPLLKQFRTTASHELASWVELAIIKQSSLFNHDLLEQELTIWTRHYPDHPAIPVITQNILLLGKQYDIHPRHIALCLPANGPYKKVSQAIRDGFLSAWYASKEFKPTISIYNANALNILDVYQTAVTDGADFIVGPLEKQAIARLLDSGSVTTRTLALNRYDHPGEEYSSQTPQTPVPALIQFGLSPEDEARQAAEQAAADGHIRALVITPDNDWGQRLSTAFRNQWQGAGGKIIEQVNYRPGTKDYATPVKMLLNIDTSEYRAKLLRQRLNRRLKSEPRLRRDADMIFMGAIPVAARQIVPQFRFYQADNIPVYSTSYIFTGHTDPQLDNDMNGVLFTDIPWLLEPAQEESTIQQSINRNWSADSSGYRRLYALGVDAYRIIPHIGRLALQRNATYQGETGDLTMTGDGIIQRKLLWAKFIRGKPQILDRETGY